jgi:hypothetical protein
LVNAPVGATATPLLIAASHALERRCRRQIEGAGHELVKQYIDDGYSGAYLDRPALNKLRRP